MIDDAKPGDLLTTSNFWGVNHVAMLVPIYGDLYVYEYTHDNRPPCVRTRQEEPEGLQVHTILDFVASVGAPTHYPLRRELFVHEYERLTETIDSCLGRGPERWGGQGTGANILAFTLQSVGIWAAPPQLWTPKRLIKALCRAGIVEKGEKIA